MKTMLFNPYSGKPRHPLDIASDPAGVLMLDPDEPVLAAPIRVRHRGDKIDQHGRVSALCFPTPRAIDMKRATWVMNDEGVTCPKCRALIEQRAIPPSGGAHG